MAATPIELTAWQRAVDGVEQDFACGGQIHVRRRYDAGLLRLLLQASNPKKYGPRPGFKRKRVLRHERKQMEREIRAEIFAKRKLIEEVRASILGKLQAIDEHRSRDKLAQGWTRLDDGHWIPPGYGLLPGHEAPQPGAAGGETPREFM